MLITPRPPDEEAPRELPLEVQLWVSKGWTIIDTQRRGIVLQGEKSMRGRSIFLIAAGVILLGLFFLNLRLPLVGGLLLVVAWLDYRFLTKPPTKFFPAAGEKTRSIER